MPSWVVNAWCSLPKFNSGEFMVGAGFEDVLASLGDVRATLPLTLLVS